MQPRIDLWYGRRQKFGHLGRPQKWINILGRIINLPSHFHSISLTYSLNDNERKVATIGPDLRRLSSFGDFNIEINVSDLTPGENLLRLFLTGRDGQITAEEVRIDFPSDKTWPLPYFIHWDQVGSLQDAAQIVDGHWKIENGFLWPVETGYDRLIAIGDDTWKDYQITIPVTIYGFSAAGYEVTSGGPGLGILMRWQGHHTWSPDIYAKDQPNFGYAPLGNIGFYGYIEGRFRLYLFDSDGPYALDNSGFEMKFGVPYKMKMQVESRESAPSMYRLKVWEEACQEPDEWQIQQPARTQELSTGSLLLVVHHTATRIGNIEVSTL